MKFESLDDGQNMTGVRGRVKRRPIGSQRLRMALFAPALLLCAAVGMRAEASVFINNTQWPQSNGYTYIHVCVDPLSDAHEKGDGANAGLIHDPNPSIEEVVNHVRFAVASSWEKYSLVRFTGWEWCSPLPPGGNSNGLRLLIQPDIDNYADSIGKSATHVQFAAWGKSFNRCIQYDASRGRVEYDFSCAEQYAIHEFGHALGFAHEWLHPMVPASCPNATPITSWSATFDESKTYTVPNADYDYNSIMTYWDGCAWQNGVRFGSPTVNQHDVDGLRAAYPMKVPPVASTELDFGGAYGYVNGTVVNNPATGAASCPSGYQDTTVYGTADTDLPVHVCLRAHTDSPLPIYDFGGMWGYIGGVPTVNPLSGRSACSDGFTDLPVLGTSDMDLPLHVCYRGHQANPPLRFGGVMGTIGGLPVPNSVTYTNECASGYQRQDVLGTAGRDWPFAYCYAKAPLQTGGLDFGGAYGFINGNTVVNNPATGNQTCPAGYQDQLAYGTNDTDLPVHICYRRHVDGTPPRYDFGGMWGFINGYSTANPLTGQSTCPAGFNDLQVLGTSLLDWPLHICYRDHVDNEPMWFGGVIGTFQGVTVPDPATGAARCPDDYVPQTVLGQTGTDWPLTYCYAMRSSAAVPPAPPPPPPPPAPSPTGVLDFGGAYGFINGNTFINNPATNGQSCPAGYQDQLAYGSNGTDFPVHICYRQHSAGTTPLYDFGGMWGFINGVATVNPLTNQSTCPSGFSDLQVLGTALVDWPLHICYRNHASNEPMWFGGVIGTVQGITVPDPATGAARCPDNYVQQMVLGQPMIDWPFSYCYAIPPK